MNEETSKQKEPKCIYVNKIKIKTIQPSMTTD